MEEVETCKSTWEEEKVVVVVVAAVMLCNGMAGVHQYA